MKGSSPIPQPLALLPGAGIRRKTSQFLLIQRLQLRLQLTVSQSLRS